MYAARDAIKSKSEQHAEILMLLAETLLRQAKGDKVEAVLKQAMTTAAGCWRKKLAEAKKNNGTVTPRLPPR